MFEWFLNLDIKLQATIVTGLFSLLAAAITGIFQLLKKNKNNGNKKYINQKQFLGNKGTQIGVQNNYNNNTTVKFEDTTIDSGTIIVDSGNASGGGGIRYESSENKDSIGENKNE